MTSRDWKLTLSAPKLWSLQTTMYRFIFSQFFYFLHICIYDHYVTRVQCLGRPEEGTRSPELQLQTAVSPPTWILRTKLKSSRRAASTLSCWVDSPRAHSILERRYSHRVECTGLVTGPLNLTLIPFHNISSFLCQTSCSLWRFSMNSVDKLHSSSWSEIHTEVW